MVKNQVQIGLTRMSGTVLLHVSYSIFSTTSDLESLCEYPIHVT